MLFTCSHNLNIFSKFQFGHAGASAAGVKETSRAKNAALKEAGAVVPDSFDDLGTAIEGVFKALVQNGTIVPAKEVAPPPVPMDYAWARVRRLFSKICCCWIYHVKDDH